MVRRLEVNNAVRVFAITTLHVADMSALQSDVGSWAAPRLTLLAGTVLGEAPFGALIQVPGDQGRLQDNADALLYLGPPSSIGMSQLPPALCADSDYMEMRLHRLALAPRPPAAPDLSQELRRYCAPLNSQ
jgi:hypothetical protein